VDHKQTKPSLERMLGILRRRTPWVLLCVVLVAGAAYAFSKHETKEYTATASLVFNNEQLGQQIAGLSVASNESPQSQENTNVKLVQLGDVAAKTAGLLGQGLTKEEIGSDLSVTGEGESNIVFVSASATSPALARDIANTYAEQFVIEQQNGDRRYYASALQLVNKQLAAIPAKERSGTAGLALQERAQSLATLSELRSGNVQVAQAATSPTSPSSPKTARNTLLGAIVGLLLGLGVALLLERFDRRIREPSDLEAIYGLPLLGVVPKSSALARSARAPRSKRGKRKANKALPPSEAEAFRLLRAHLYHLNVDRELRTLLVTSAAPGDGKTTVARHLASTAARMGSRVLLLEADLRHPTLAGQLDLQPEPGVSDVLIGAVSLSEATQMIEFGVPFVDGPGEQMLDVAVAGAAFAPDPADLIESPAMGALLERAKSTYDLVVIDTPPLAAVSDAFPLLAKVDGVIIVGRIGRNRRDVAEHLHETLAGAGVPLLGVVANGLKAGLASYGYSSDYANAGAERTATAEVSTDRASVNGASVNGALANGVSAKRIPPSVESMPTDPAHRTAPTYGEAVDLLGRLGDLAVEPPSDERGRSGRGRRASRRG
jgi:succinoglycan biosynthesis transport protein ExoP